MEFILFFVLMKLLHQALNVLNYQIKMSNFKSDHHPRPSGYSYKIKSSGTDALNINTARFNYVNKILLGRHMQDNHLPIYRHILCV